MSHPVNAKVEQDPLYALLVAGIERQIIDGVLPPGFLLRSSTIARQLDISRAPVKAALEILSDRGWVEAASGSFRVSGEPHSHEAENALDALAVVPPDVERRIRSNGAVWLQVFDEIEAEIAAAIPFGAFRVSEAKLTETFDVSRTVIRNVLSRLEERGLVRRAPRGACVCGPLTEGRIEEIYEARLLIEPYALRKVSPGLDQAWVRACLAKLAAVQKAYPNVAPDVLEGLENDLHVTAYESLDNDILKQTIESTRLMLISTTQAFKRTLGLPEEDPFVAEHRLVFEQILAGAHDLAAAALRYHLERARQVNIERFRALSEYPYTDIPPYLLAVE